MVLEAGDGLLKLHADCPLQGWLTCGARAVAIRTYRDSVCAVRSMPFFDGNCAPPRYSTEMTTLPRL